MDDPGLEPARHRRALRALRRVNVVSGTTGRIWRVVEPEARRRSRPLRILDVGCGGGDTLVALGRRAAAAGVSLELHGCDRSPLALDEARASAASAGVHVHLHRLDVLEDELPDGFDLVTVTLFLHHLDRAQAVRLLERLGRVAPGGIVQDLVRSRLGYALAWAGLRVLSRSRVAWVDGPRSVAAGFSLDEAARLAGDAGLPEVRVGRVWPERLLLRWGWA